jgi:hypothetical protein
MYEVYALTYGERDTTMCQFFYREHRHEPLTLHYFVWLIMGGPHPVLVDTGFRDDDAQARGIKNYVSPAEVVERFGVKASDVPLCLISHLHYDHWAGHTLFPNAQFWIQKDEVAFWTGRHAGTPAFRGSANVPSLANLVTLNYQGRIKIIDGAHEVLPGIRVPGVGTMPACDRERRDPRAPGDLTSDASHFTKYREPPPSDHHELPEMLTPSRPSTSSRARSASSSPATTPRWPRGSRRRSREWSRSPDGIAAGAPSPGGASSKGLP